MIEHLCAYNTPPHVIDPKYPGAVDEIIHLGDYWNEEALIANRDKIVKAIDDNGKIYKRVYKYLGAAKLVQDDVEWIYEEATNKDAERDAVQQFIEKVTKGYKNNKGLHQTRHLFGSAYTFFGHIHHAETYLNPIKKRYTIQAASIKKKSDVLKQVADKFIEKGYNLELYHHPMVPDWLETVIVPELSIAVTCYPSSKAKRVLDLDAYLDSEVLVHYFEELEYGKNFVNQLLDQVFDNLKKTKVNHDYIETFYSPNIRFTEIDQLVEQYKKKLHS